LSTQEWTDIPEMAYSRHFGSMAVVGKKAFIFGGFFQKSAEVFDLETRQWTTLSPISINCWGCAAVAIGNFTVVVGGDSDVVELFDIGSQTWSMLQNLSLQRIFRAAGLVGNQLIVVDDMDNNDNLLGTAVSLDLRDFMVPILPKTPNILELEHEEREGALKNWVTQVKTVKQEYLANVKTEIFRLNKDCATKK